MPQLTPDRIFELHPRIRWAGLSTDQGEVVFTKMRSGIESLSPESADVSFMQLGPMLLSGVCERLNPWAGELECTVVRYEKVVMIVTKLGSYYLAVTIDKTGSNEIIGDVIVAIERLRPEATALNR